MHIDVRATGLIEPRRLQAWSVERQKKNQAVVRKGMLAAAPQLKKLVRDAAASGLRIRRKVFLNVFRTKLWDKKPNELPALQLFADSRLVPWIGIHETGGTISGKMIIPLLDDGKRISRKKFSALLDSLRQQGNLFFKKDGNRTLVFAENLGKGGVSGLSQFKKATRSRTGAKRLKRGADVLIGVIVSNVTLVPRLHFAEAAKKGGAIVATEIRNAFEQIK